MSKAQRTVRGSKRYKKAVSSVDREKRYDVEAAINALKNAPAAKFDETVDLVVRLGIDLKRNDGGVRGTLTLPHGIGKTKSVIAFCEGELADEAKAAGAIEAGGEDLVKKVQDGWTDFDVAVAHPSMMRFVGRLGRVLGPQGKMPSPKAGTVTDQVVTAVTEFAAGKVEFRTDGGGNVHMPVGKRSFEADALTENINAALEHLLAARPANAKGAFLKQAHVSTTMGPGLELAV
jgi:large subunit ribosomal protein L1